MAINVEKTYTGTGAQDAIILNRYGDPQTSVVVDLATTGDVTIEGTLSQLNRDNGLTAIWFEIENLINLTADSNQRVENTPLEAIRANITTNATGVTLQVMQND